MRTAFVFAMLLGLTGCNLMSGLGGGDKAPDAKPVPSIVFSEQDYWDQLAKNVGADVFSNSDDLCYAVDCLVKTGELKDVSRLAEVRKKRTEPIAGDDKVKLIALLKGQ